MYSDSLFFSTGIQVFLEILLVKELSVSEGHRKPIHQICTRSLNLLWIVTCNNWIAKIFISPEMMTPQIDVILSILCFDGQWIMNDISFLINSGEEEATVRYSAIIIYLQKLSRCCHLQIDRFNVTRRSRIIQKTKFRYSFVVFFFKSPRDNFYLQKEEIEKPQKMLWPEGCIARWLHREKCVHRALRRLVHDAHDMSFLECPLQRLLQSSRGASKYPHHVTVGGGIFRQQQLKTNGGRGWDGG